MRCLYCGIDDRESAAFCSACGKQMPVYAAPDGFSFQVERGLYCRQTDKEIVWFDPVSGQYDIEAAPAAAETAPGAEAEPENWLTQASDPIPEGFSLQESSGLYCREEPGGTRWYDPLTGQYVFQETAKEPQPEPSSAPVTHADVPPAPSHRYALPEGFAWHGESGLAFCAQPPVLQDDQEIVEATWFDPATGEYAQVRYVTPSPAPALEERAPKPHRRGALVAALLAALLLAGGGFVWALFNGRVELPFPAPGPSPSTSDATVQSKPEDARVESAPESNPRPKESAPSEGWADVELEQAVRSYLGVPDGAIDPEALADVREVWVVHADIWFYFHSDREKFAYTREGYVKSIDDLAKFPRLEAVALEYAPNLKDFSVFRSLASLETLHFWYIDPELILPQIEGLSGLRHLRIYECGLSGLDGMETLTGLEHLELRDMPIADLSPLKGLANLQYVELTGLEVTDYSPVAHVPEKIGVPETDPASDTLNLENLLPDMDMTLRELLSDSKAALMERGLLGRLIYQDGLFAQFTTSLPGTFFCFDSTGVSANDNSVPLLAIETEVERLYGSAQISVAELKSIYKDNLIVDTFTYEGGRKEAVWVYAYHDDYALYFFIDGPDDEQVERFMVMHSDTLRTHYLNNRLP